MNPAQEAHGPGLIGAFINVFLFGIMVAQVYVYLTKFKKDRTWTKALVLFLLAADCANSVLDIYWLYSDIVTNFGNAEAIAFADWRLATDPALVSIIATTVQGFYAWRVQRLTGNFWLTTFVVLTAIISLCGGIGTAIAITIVREYANFQKFEAIAAVWLVATAVCDVVIALSLTWFMQSNKTGITQTDDVLNKLTRITMQNGALTAIWAIVDLILFLAIKSGVHLAMNLPLAKLYTNSLMSTLNSRAGWGFDGSDGEEGHRMQRVHMKSNAMPDFLTLSTHGQQARTPEVVIHVEHDEVTDANSQDDNKWGERSVVGGAHDADDTYKASTVV